MSEACPPECTPPSPIVINLKKGDYRFSDVDGGVGFDVNGDGRKERLAWTLADSDIGFLALDRNGNGTIDNGLELFGNFTYQFNRSGRNGFAALAIFDSPQFGGNENGRIDSGDSTFSLLRIWVDRNHNGLSEPDELHSLLEGGIESISVNYELSPRRDGAGNQLRYRAKVTASNGSQASSWAYDVFLLSTAITNAPVPSNADSRNNAQNGQR